MIQRDSLFRMVDEPRSHHQTPILLVIGKVHQSGSPEQFTKNTHFTLYNKVWELCQ